MKTTYSKRLKGLYLVLDPSQDWDLLLAKTSLALKGGVQILQLWNHWKPTISNEEKRTFVEALKCLSEKHGVPLIMHDDWHLAKEEGMDGVHLDAPTKELTSIQKAFPDGYIGVTVSNDLNTIRWADENQLAYVSFCSVFPSASVSSCDIVSPENIEKARRITSLPIFLSGGINMQTVEKLAAFDFDGIAVISGILSADDPQLAAQQYQTALHASTN